MQRGLQQADMRLAAGDHDGVALGRVTCWLLQVLGQAARVASDRLGWWAQPLTQAFFDTAEVHFAQGLRAQRPQFGRVFAQLGRILLSAPNSDSYTHLRAHETDSY